MLQKLHKEMLEDGNCPKLSLTTDLEEHKQKITANDN